MRAIIRADGRQYKVRQGDTLTMDLMDKEEGAEVEFSEVLLVEHDDGVRIGQPVVENAKVTGRVVGLAKGDKLRIFKHRRRKNHRKTLGHRQKFTRVLVESITVP